MTQKFTRAWARLIAASIAVGVAATIGGVSQAHADSTYVATGRIQCINSGEPTGVWVEAADGGSGWATTWQDVADGFGWLHYSKEIPAGGSFYLSVGCGGSNSSWGTTTYSDSFAGPVDVHCNDIPWLLEQAGRLYPFIGRLGIAQGIPTGRCTAV